MKKQTSRRRTLAVLSGLASATVLAGCTSADDAEDPGDDDEEEEEQDGEEEQQEEQQDEEQQDEEQQDEEQQDEEQQDEEQQDEGEEEEEEPTQELDPEQWEDVESVRVLSRGAIWVGSEPEMIDGVENPTLILFEGQEYGLTYENADGGGHNIEVRDDSNGVVGDYETEVVYDGEQTLEIVATDDMSTYVCDPHQGSMVGDIRIE